MLQRLCNKYHSKASLSSEEPGDVYQKDVSTGTVVPKYTAQSDSVLS